MNNEKARVIDVPFSRGVRQDVESRTAPLGALTFADNLEFDQQNRLVRRDSFETLGTTVLGKTNALDFPVRRAVQAPGGERLLFTDQNFFTYYPSRDGMTEGGLNNEPAALRATLRETLGIAADECGLIDFCDGCAVNGYAVYAYAKDFGSTVPGAANFVHLDVISIKDGARVITNQAISNGSIAYSYAKNGGQVRCVVSGGSNVVFVVWAPDPAAVGQLIYVKVTLDATVTVGPPTVLLGDSDAPAVFDVDTMASGWVLVYGQNAGAHQAVVQTFDSTATPTHAFVWKAAAGTAAWQPSALAVSGDAAFGAARVHLSGYDPATFKTEVVTLTSALASPLYSNFDPGLSHTKPARQMAIAHVDDVTSILLFSNYTNQPRGHLYVYFVGDGAATLPIKDFANYTLASKIYVDKRAIGAVFAMARFDDATGLQNHFLLLDLGAGGFYGFVRPTFHIASGRVPLQADNSYTGIGGILDLSFEEPGLFQVFLRQNVGASQISGNQVTAYTCTSCRSDRFLSTPCQGEAVVGGGTPLTYDGQRLVELSFYSYPVWKGFNSLPTGGTIAQGIYQYRLVYEWTDAKGNRHQSPASPAQTADMSGAPYAAGTNFNEVFYAAYHATRKHYQFLFAADPHADEFAPTRIVVYRTVKGSSGPFYRLPKAGENNVQTVFITPSFVDTYPDSAITGNEVLYEKDGGRGELATIAPPPCVHMTTHQQRLWGLDGEDPERIWATKTMSPLTAPGYSPALQIFIPGAGKINGLAGQDGKLYALATNGIYLASYGDGPDNAGGGSFPSPQLISTDATCDDPRGVLAASNGIYFTGRDKWGQGIYLIRRGDGTPIPIGRRIKEELSLWPVCRGAVDRIDKARAEFLFTTNDFSATPGNRSIIAYYHYDLLDEEGIGQWTIARPTSHGGDYSEFECLGVWAETQDLGVIGGPPRLDSILADTPTNGSVGAQRRGVLRDFGSIIPRTLIETTDIRAFGLTGFGAIRGITMYGTSIDADPIRMEASYDAGSRWTDVHSFGSAPVSSGDPILFRWETPTQKLPDGGMVRFRVADESQGEFVPGTSWFHGLSIEVEPLGGDARLRASERG